MPKKEHWIITLTGEQPLPKAIAGLRKAGLEIDQVMDVIGVVTGSAGKAEVNKLRKVVGVADVSPDSAVDIGPPDAGIS
jgi:glycine cleavage system aminomethyltransferase T